MKKIAFLLAAIAIAFAQMQAQDYLLNFVGSGSSAPIETIEVANLTKGTSLTMNGTDTLHLLFTVGLNGLKPNDANGLAIYPNPATNIANIEFFMQHSGSAVVDIVDLNGKSIATLQTHLTSGLHRVVVGNLPNGLYQVVIKTERELFSGKIVSQNHQRGALKISCEPIGKSNLKSGRSVIEMQYNDGDLLLFKAFSGNYVAVLPLIPTQSTAVTFNFIAATDYDGNNYGTLAIGNQIWISENIKTTHYPDGAPIPHITDFAEWGNLGDNNTDDAYCWYSNDEITYKNLYGALYTYAAATNGDNGGNNVQGVCPDGWHVPNDAEWATLAGYLSVNGYPGNEGVAIKATSGWFNPGNGTNNFGFSALPCGYRNYIDGTFEYATLYGYSWSSTESGDEFAWNRYLSFSYTNIGRYLSYKSIGFSVRCLKD